MPPSSRPSKRDRTQPIARWVRWDSRRPPLPPLQLRPQAPTLQRQLRQQLHRQPRQPQPLRMRARPPAAQRHPLRPATDAPDFARIHLYRQGDKSRGIVASSRGYMQLTSATSAPTPLSLTLPALGFAVMHALAFSVVSRHWQKLEVLTHELLNVPAPSDRATLPLHPL